MKKIQKLGLLIVAAGILVLVSIIRNLYPSYPYRLIDERSMDMIMLTIYIAIFTLWGNSIKRRIIQKQTRELFMMIYFTEIIWMFFKLIHVAFISGERVAQCYYWYASMIPVIIMPSFMLMAAISMDQEEKYRLPRRIVILTMMPILLLITMVMTNDLHEFVFILNKGSFEYFDMEAGPGLYIAIAWVFSCMIGFVFILLKKYRGKRTNRSVWLVMLPLAFGLVYALSVLSPFYFLDTVFRDITFTVSLFYCMLIEVCVFCGLIQTNSGYDSLFKNGTLGGCIVDKAGEIVYISSNAMELDREQIHRVTESQLNINDKYLITGAPIAGGYVMWQEDISPITEALEKLKENREKLAEMVEIQKENYETKRKINSSREKNRLYDEFMQHTSDKIEELDNLINSYEVTRDSEDRKKLLSRMCILGSYIKRRGNMTYIRDSRNFIDIYEMALSLEETLSNLKLMGSECAVDVGSHGMVLFDEAMECYEKIEKMIEDELDNISCLWVKIREKAGGYVVHMEIVKKSDENDVVTLSLPLGKAGDDE